MRKVHTYYANDIITDEIIETLDKLEDDVDNSGDVKTSQEYIVLRRVWLLVACGEFHFQENIKCWLYKFPKNREIISKSHELSEMLYLLLEGELQNALQLLLLFSKKQQQSPTS